MSDLEFWKDLSHIFDAVLGYQKKNVEFNNRFINPWIRLGNIFERDHRNSGAVQAYKHATEIDPDSAQNWADLGNAHFQAGDHTDAIAAYHKAIEIDPEAGWPLGNLALTLVMQDNVEDAIPLYQRSIELLTEPEDKAICWNRLGNAYRKLNDYENAFNAFKKADELDGENTGFNDKLDETPAEVSVVALEEIPGQMTAEQPAGEAEAAAAAPEVVDESVQADSPVAVETPSMIETEDGRIALAPNMEMKVGEIAEEEVAVLVAETAAVEEPSGEMPVEETVNETAAVEEEVSPLVMHGKSLEALKVVEELIAKVEERFNQLEAAEQSVLVAGEESARQVESVMETAEEVAPVASEEATQEVEAIAESAPVASEETPLEVVVESEPVAGEEAIQEVEPVAAQTEAVAAGPVTVSEAGAQEVESVAAQAEMEAPELETPAASPEEAAEVEEPYKIPTWLAIKNVVKAFEKSMTKEERAEVQAQENFAQAESMTIVSAVSQETSVSESVVNMDIVETYTDPLAAQLTTGPILSEEPVLESAEQVEGNALDPAAGSEPVVESAVTEESVEQCTAEAAYEEYLKDATEPEKALADHVNEIQNTASLKVSQNGEVRIAMDTKNAHVWNELGNVYMNSGSYDDAIASYSKAIELDRNFAWPYSNLALAYVQKGRFAEAVLFYQRGIELFSSDKDKATTWNRLGNVYRRINDYSNAIAAYKVADELDPENTTLSLRASFGLLGNMYAETTSAYAA